MTAYGKHSKNTPTPPAHIDLALNMLPNVKLEALAPVPAGDVLNLEESTIVPVHFQGSERVEGGRRRGRRRKEEKKFVALEESTDVYEGTTDDEGADHREEFSDDGGIKQNNVQVHVKIQIFIPGRNQAESLIVW